MPLNLLRQIVLTCSLLSLTGLLLAACAISPHAGQTPTANFLVKVFSSIKVAGEEVTVPAGQAVVIYSDHLTQAGGSRNEAVSRAKLQEQLQNLADSPAFEKIPAVWALSNNCTYTVFVDVYYVGALRITVVDTKLSHQIVSKWSTSNKVATHYRSENEIPCLSLYSFDETGAICLHIL